MSAWSFKLRFAIRWGLVLIGLMSGLSAVSCAEEAWVRVKWVSDGDTIVLRDGRHVRYIGIDAPEIDHENQRAAPMGYEARSKNRQLVEDRLLRLDYDQEKKDRYERVLAYVYRRDGLFVNAELLKGGYAYVLTRSPNTRKAKILLSAQREAMTHRRGIWQHVDRYAKPSHAFVGNRRSKRFHTHDCNMGKTMSTRNRVRLDNLWDAFWSGYAPASECVTFPGRE